MPATWSAGAAVIPRPLDQSPRTTTGKAVRSADALSSAATP
ncbi:hypothetical protein [Micromonospora sp. BL4]|nr:hypothetical protein [Micromonospora sp. BL4]